MAEIPKSGKKGDEFATAILNTKSKPNRLLVEDAVNDDNSVTRPLMVHMNFLELNFALLVVFTVVSNP